MRITNIQGCSSEERLIGNETEWRNNASPVLSWAEHQLESATLLKLLSLSRWRAECAKLNMCLMQLRDLLLSDHSSHGIGRGGWWWTQNHRSCERISVLQWEMLKRRDEKGAVNCTSYQSYLRARGAAIWSCRCSSIALLGDGARSSSYKVSGVVQGES